MSVRQERMADQVRDLVARRMAHLNDPRVQGVTVTHVRMSGDLQIATVYFRLFEDATDVRKEAQKGLSSCAGLLRKELASYLDVRRAPELRFFYDESVEHGARIEELLQEIKKG